MNLEEIILCIISNRDWIFSGIGVFILGLFLNKSIGKKKTIKQSQKSGNNSTNIQVGRDYNNDKYK